MKTTRILSALALACLLPAAAQAGVFPQCPFNGGTVSTDPASGLQQRWRTVGSGANAHRQVCMHITGGDGWMVMGDGRRLYGFGFGTAQGEGDDVMRADFNAQFAAPTITLREGDEVWLALTNVGMLLRPDLFDQHSVHFHGFPNASAVFDGVPQGSITVNMGSTFTYYYNVKEPGTYMYHCHVEATEHMQMGMLGMLNVLPKQTGSSVGGYTRFAYDDGDGATGYDVEASLQMGGMDSNFHELHEGVQPLPFLEMKADYAILNGRGYPMTTITDKAQMQPVDMDDGSQRLTQPIHSVVTAQAGQKVLLRLTNLSVLDYYTVTALGLPMKVVGRGGHIARGAGNTAADSWAYGTASVTIGGGEGVDVLLDTTGAAPGTYFLYTTNLNYLSNGAEDDRGGLMTKIVLN